MSSNGGNLVKEQVYDERWLVREVEEQGEGYTEGFDDGFQGLGGPFPDIDNYVSGRETGRAYRLALEHQGGKFSFYCPRRKCAYAAQGCTSK